MVQPIYIIVYKGTAISGTKKGGVLLLKLGFLYTECNNFTAMMMNEK